MILIHTNAASDLAIRNEALAEFEAAHGAVIGELSPNGELIETHELAVPGAKVVHSNGGLSIPDGPFAETTEWISGYDIIDVASEERVIEIAARLVEARYTAVKICALILPPL